MSVGDPNAVHRKHMVRHEASNDLRFLTFSTYLRLPLFLNDRIKDLFVSHLVRAKATHRFHLYAWVLMPEHVHMILWPRLPESPVSVLLSEFKRRFARVVIDRWRELQAPILTRIQNPDGSTRFWQRGGGYDRNIFSGAELSEKIRYIHHNPVARGLCHKPEGWAWSSAGWFAGDRDTPLVIDEIPPKKPV